MIQSFEVIQGFEVIQDKQKRLLLSAFLAEIWQAQKIGGELVFSADLCYNGMGDENGRTKKSQDHSVERSGL